jgi:hypothetical protein
MPRVIWLGLIRVVEKLTEVSLTLNLAIQKLMTKDDDKR